jgi:hypothetical protein
MSSDRTIIIRQLQAGTCTVKFTKKNGEIRVMRATMNSAEIPEDKKPKDPNARTVAATNPSLIKAFDVEKRAWRSFHVDSVISVGL